MSLLRTPKEVIVAAMIRDCFANTEIQSEKGCYGRYCDACKTCFIWRANRQYCNGLAFDNCDNCTVKKIGLDEVCKMGKKKKLKLVTQVQII